MKVTGNLCVLSIKYGSSILPVTKMLKMLGWRVVISKIKDFIDMLDVFYVCMLFYNITFYSAIYERSDTSLKSCLRYSCWYYQDITNELVTNVDLISKQVQLTFRMRGCPTVDLYD